MNIQAMIILLENEKVLINVNSHLLSNRKMKKSYAGAFISFQEKINASIVHTMV